MAVFYVLVALALSLMHHFLSVENFCKTWGVFNIKAVFPQLPIDRATNPQVHVPAGECEAKPRESDFVKLNIPP